MLPATCNRGGASGPPHRAAGGARVCGVSSGLHRSRSRTAEVCVSTPRRHFHEHSLACRAALVEDDLADTREAAVPSLCAPGPYQQTLASGFTVQGIGRHTAEIATVRVRPANVGDGRYFVRVPEGTNVDRAEAAIAREKAATGPPAPSYSTELEARRTKWFLRYLAAQEDEGWDGSFEDFLMHTKNEHLLEDAPHHATPGFLADDDTEVTPKPTDGTAVDASVANVELLPTLSTSLGSGPAEIKSVETLLSVLEAVGVDNARIEIEGGSELPVMDGSAYAWWLQVQRAGVTPAVGPHPRKKSAEQASRFRLSMEPGHVVSVRDGESFITYYPGPSYLITAGISHPEAPVIGDQWLTFNLLSGDPYGLAIAPARLYATCPEQLRVWRKLGLAKSGLSSSALVAYGEVWYEPSMCRFQAEGDEPARYVIQSLIGNLSLMASGGNSGIPKGHIVSYRATNGLVMKFCREMVAKLDPSKAEEEWGLALSIVSQPDLLMPEDRELLHAAIDEAIEDPDIDVEFMAEGDTGDEHDQVGQEEDLAELMAEAQGAADDVAAQRGAAADDAFDVEVDDEDWDYDEPEENTGRK